MFKTKYDINNILKLRSLGYSCNKIAKTIGCSKGTVVYYSTPNFRENSIKRIKLRGWKKLFSQKIQRFKKYNCKNKIRKDSNNSWKEIFYKKICGFLSSIDDFKSGNLITKTTTEINIKTVLTKISNNPRCYLTGDLIDLTKTSTYHLDHRIPRSKGGLNTLENLEIATSEANLAKSNKTPEEFIELCKKVLEYNGYMVMKNEQTD